MNYEDNQFYIHFKMFKIYWLILRYWYVGFQKCFTANFLPHEHTKNTLFSPISIVGKNWIVKLVWKLNSHQNINILVSDSKSKVFRNVCKTDYLHNSALIESLRKLICWYPLGFDKWFTIHFSLMDIEKKCMHFYLYFIQFFPKNIQAEHLVRFYCTHPLLWSY